MNAAIRDCVKDFRRVPARDLLDNQGNPRTYPQAQRDALRGLLEQVGIAGALIAYASERNGGQPERGAGRTMTLREAQHG